MIHMEKLIHTAHKHPFLIAQKTDKFQFVTSCLLTICVQSVNPIHNYAYLVCKQTHIVCEQFDSQVSFPTQSTALRIIVGAPWYVRNDTLYDNLRYRQSTHSFAHFPLITNSTFMRIPMPSGCHSWTTQPQFVACVAIIQLTSPKSFHHLNVGWTLGVSSNSPL